MKKSISFFCIFLTVFSPFFSPSFKLCAEGEVADSVFVDYQNYNHDYCPQCDCYPCRCGSNGECNAPCNTCAPANNVYEPCDAPCDEAPCDSTCNPCNGPTECNPCAPVCGSQCGISACTLGVAIAALITAAVLIVTSGNGSASH